MSSRPRILLTQPICGYIMELFQGFPIPLAPLAVAGSLTPEFEVEIFDQRLHPLHWRDRLDEALAREPLLVGFTAMIGPSVGNSLDLARHVRRRRPQVPLVWGGTQPSLVPAQALADPAVDFVVEGEGEQTVLELARALAAGREPAGIRGLHRRRGDGVEYGGRRPFLDPQDLPPLPYELIDMGRYERRYRGGGWISLETSRGCPSACGFCYGQVVHRGCWRPQPAEAVVAQIEAIVDRFGLRQFYLVDDNFFADLDRVDAIARAITPLGIRWINHGLSMTSARRITNAQLDLYRRSGLLELSTGAESGSRSILASMSKGIDPAWVLAFNRQLAQHGIQISYGLVSGVPEETEEDLRATVELALRLVEEHPRAYIKHIVPFLPHPGTDLFADAVARGYRGPQTFAEWSDVDVTRAHGTWLSSADRRRLEVIFVCSVFLAGSRLEGYGTRSRLARLAEALYSPVARWRLRNMRLELPAERLFVDALTWALERGHKLLARSVV